MRAAAEERFDGVFSHLDAVARYARRRGARDPDNVAAECMTIAWRRLDDIPGGRPACRGCSAARAASCSRSYRHERGRVPLDERPGAALRGARARRPRRGAVRCARRALGHLDREALLLVAWEDLTPTQAARALGINPVAFRVRLHRARRRCSSALDSRLDRATPDIRSDSEVTPWLTCSHSCAHPIRPTMRRRSPIPPPSAARVTAAAPPDAPAARRLPSKRLALVVAIARARPRRDRPCGSPAHGLRGLLVPGRGGPGRPAGARASGCGQRARRADARRARASVASRLWAADGLDSLGRLPRHQVPGRVVGSRQRPQRRQRPLLLHRARRPDVQQDPHPDRDRLRWRPTRRRRTSSASSTASSTTTSPRTAVKLVDRVTGTSVPIIDGRWFAFVDPRADPQRVDRQLVAYDASGRIVDG